MLKRIFGVLAALVGVVLIFALMQPDTFTVQRSAESKAPREKVFPLVNDFAQWKRWSPWGNEDPAMKRTLSTDTTGKGATYAWAGNKDVGEGRMAIAEWTPPAKVDIKLDFIVPFEAQNLTTFAFESKGAGTQVTWAMQGPMPFISKVFSVFASIYSTVGREFTTGLSNMKDAAEG